MNTAPLRGQRVQTARLDEPTREWVILFTGGVVLQTGAAWRLRTPSRIAIGWRDHGQYFGREHPFDVEVELVALCGDSPVAEADITERPGHGQQHRPGGDRHPRALAATPLPLRFGGREGDPVGALSGD